MRKVLSLLLAAMLLSSTPSFAQDDGQQEKEAATPKEMFKELKSQSRKFDRDLQKKAREIQSKMSEAESEDEQEKILEEMNALREERQKFVTELSSKVLALAEMADEDAATSLEAIRWVLENTENDDTIKSARELVVKHHINNEDILKMLSGMVSGMPSQGVKDLFDAVIEKTESEAIRGVATLNRLDFLTKAAELKSQFADNQQIQKSYPDIYKFVTELEEMDDEAVLAEYKMIAEKFADVEYKGKSVGDVAASKMKVIETRARTKVGKVAPDIVGPDIDGVEFKLSDYRGKVVMLDFWGDW